MRPWAHELMIQNGGELMSWSPSLSAALVIIDSPHSSHYFNGKFKILSSKHDHLWDKNTLHGEHLFLVLFCLIKAITLPSFFLSHRLYSRDAHVRNRGLSLTHKYLRVTPKIVVWFEDTLDHNFWIENEFTKYLKESCWKCSNPDFSFKYVANYALAWKISSHLSGWFWRLWALMG